MFMALTGLCVGEDGRWCSAGAGKSTVANRLVSSHRFVEVSLADPLKRFLVELFDWSPDLLWGDSELKNHGDPRYVRPDGSLVSPRLAMQLVATEGMRSVYSPIWAEYACRVSDSVMNHGLAYSRMGGLRHWREGEQKRYNVVISDVRFRDEVKILRRAGALIVRVKRPVASVTVPTHRSELELVDMPDSEFDYVLEGPEFGVPEVRRLTDAMMAVLREREANREPRHA